VNDADELPRREIIANLSQQYNSLNLPLKFQQVFFYYSFKWVSRGIWWMGTYAINDKGLRDSSSATTGKASTLDELRKETNESNFQIVKNAGWHCSFCMTSSDIQRKLSSFAHVEYTHFSGNIGWIDHCRATGMDLFRRPKLSKLSYRGDYGYPECGNASSLHIPNFKVLSLPVL